MKIATISTFPPRECGIATFNQNLLHAIGANLPENDYKKYAYVLALNDSEDPDEYKYGEEVQVVIRQDHQKDYVIAATHINSSNAEVCILQHEFGIYGGESGIYILPLLHRLEKPLISILHTVLEDPSFIQKIIIQEIGQRSQRIVVMSKKAVEFLTGIYQIPIDKIQIIEHGVPDYERLPKSNAMGMASFKNKKVLFTFGLLSRGKGIETVVKALPAIVEQHPDVVYVVLGNTHPGVRKVSGEEYRDSLKLLAKQLKVDNNLHFINRFASEEDLFAYLSATNIYITPYLSKAQITSGTLSYAVGAGAAVVSTPYYHAEELLDEGRGRLFKFKDSEALASTIIDLFNHPKQLDIIRQKAYEYGLNLRWPKVGEQYLSLINSVASIPFGENALSKILDPELMPKFSLAHVLRLTDDTGIVQHAKYGIPNLKEGYCLDDNSRALIMALMAYQQNKSHEALRLLPIYLSYIHYMQQDDGSFRNFLSFDRRYLDNVGSEDSFGRTVWALGYLINCAPNNSYREFARELYMQSVQHFERLHHLRGFANTVIGVAYFLRSNPSDEGMVQHLVKLTKPLIDAYKQKSTRDWQWFEETMTYDNAILPLALLHSSEITGDEEVKKVALKTLSFLDKVCFDKGYLTPVGNAGWYTRGGNFPMFDQQAIESMGMVMLYFQSYRITKDASYIQKLFMSYLWFLGENALRAPLYDHETKGCCDGLDATGINRNQGAESTLAYMISHLSVLKAFELEYEYTRSRQSKLMAV